ncbi:MAG: hypothetical protein WD267_12015 [Balneolales bacterium]
MRILLYLFFFVTIICSNIACDNSVSDEEEECVPEFPDENVTYNNYVANVVSNNCTSCHRTGGEGPGDFTSYDGLVPYASHSSFEFRVLSDNADMPQDNPPLPKSTRDSLSIWINNCLPE